MTATAGEDGTGRAGPFGRLAVSVRLFVLSAVLLAGVGALGHGLGWVVLTTTVGPTAYVLLAHPDTAGSRVRNAVVGHASAVACGLALLAVFGLWNHASVAQTNHDTPAQIAAEALAAAATLFCLTLLDAHHPPAAATALLIASGIARPGPPLYGMLVGLAVTVVAASALTRLPGLRNQTAREHSP
ncbi:HPP family protein [Streptomyces sp. ICBB 8177]|uniref:HPP family protein n=1 Tax=Streptomyces sp. ICBB 8177 TaxID=563922 RepID=UPI000D67E969|nr:HPP family protein [Streptomyces sp. ICBB 8177]PWI44477.1 hypothetical protein CK485_12340 [Streptomyces sp. ICBB 8177]